MTGPDRDLIRDWYPAGGPQPAELADWYGERELPAVPEESPAETAAEERALRRKLRRSRILAAALCVVLLASACLTTLQYLRQVRERAAAEMQGMLPVPAPLLPEDDTSEHYDDFKDYFANYFSHSDGVSIPPAQTGTGVTLPLWGDTGLELSLQDIYALVSPAVVGITATLDGEPYSWGTGVVFTEDGYIITNTHIISGCDGAKAAFPDGSEYELRLVGSDIASDIAVLKMDGEGFPYAAFGSSDDLRVGDWVAAIGNPLGEAYSGTMTDGIISAIDRSVSNNGHPMTLLQTNAALNEGNSGGPLINSRGQVIGITNMKIMSVFTSTVEGIGFAIPSGVVKQVADQLIERGGVPGQPSIGITAGPVSQEAMRLYDLPAGVYVASVNDASDAHAKGLLVGDIILKVNGEPVASVADVNAIKDQFTVGDTITLTVFREGKTFTMDIALVDQADMG